MGKRCDAVTVWLRRLKTVNLPAQSAEEIPGSYLPKEEACASFVRV
jgi:hypothetical protein